jgi:hypothetical protein
MIDQIGSMDQALAQVRMMAKDYREKKKQYQN